MPLYNYQCESCGVQFEGRSSVARREDPKPCPACEAMSNIVPPERVGGFFRKEVTGLTPQNTGIAGLDTNFDRVVAEDARRKWRVQATRRQMKESLIVAGVEPNHIRRRLDGLYDELGDPEFKIQRRAMRIHEAYGKWSRTGKQPGEKKT